MSNNKDNLKPLNQLCKEDAKEIRSKGGKARAENIAKAKSLKEAMSALLELPATPENKSKMKGLGVDDSNLDNRTLLAIGLMKKAMSGDVNAFNSIRDLIGEKPTDKVELDDKTTGAVAFSNFIGGIKNGETFNKKNEN